MIIKPKVRGFICISAHPQGCYEAVKKQVDFVKANGQFEGPKNVLVIGSSTGYGLASRIAATFGAGAKTIGVFFEKEPSEKKTATAGWYNTAAFEQLAQQEGHYARSFNGDAFSHDMKRQVAEAIREDLGKVDLVVYSLASPRRVHPDSGEIYSSVLKPIGEIFNNKTVDPIRGEVKDITIEPATDDEIANTIRVMGGEDWQMWMDYLSQQGVLADDATTLAYSYIGPNLTHAIYKEGAIGQAKAHLQETADQLNAKLQPTGGRAFISVNKAIVTQASAAIPVVPLYISLLFKVMKEKGTHEGCIEQIARMFKDKIYTASGPIVDDAGRVRVDDLEMDPEVQAKVAELWPQVTSENLESLTDIQGYRDDFYHLFGFGYDQVDYEAETDQLVAVPSIQEEKV